mgnify:CR=1 FL=1
MENECIEIGGERREKRHVQQNLRREGNSGKALRESDVQKGLGLHDLRLAAGVEMAYSQCNYCKTGLRSVAERGGRHRTRKKGRSTSKYVKKGL